jgi:tetratricopeptide (TPR) repeat protein
MPMDGHRRVGRRRTPGGLVVEQVVVLAYGPGFHTHAAVARAQALTRPGGRVWVVPALPPAQEAVDLLAIAPPPGVVPITTPGSAGLRLALEQAADVPTLLLHDDVEISADHVAMLVAEADATEATVVPALEGVTDCDHGADVLPAVDRIEVHRVRPVCLVATPDQLYALSARALVDPRVRFDDVSWGFVALPAARAHHVGRCATRLLGPDSPEGRPLLVAHAIVRDEEETLPGLLASLTGLVDRIEICDTGSTDRTVEIAEAAGCHVIHRAWRDDFAWARNEVLDECRDAWYVLMVDADDRVHCDDPTLLRRQLATFREEAEAYRVQVRSRLSADESTERPVYGSEMWSIRIFRPDRAAWFGRIHEVACRTGTGDPLPSVPLDALWVEHVGYTPALLATRDKATRNIDIARSAYEEDPTGKAALEYARSLMLTDSDPADQLRLMLEVVEKSTQASPSTRAHVLGSTAIVHLALGQHDEAMDLAGQALDLVPADDIAARAFAEACDALGRDEALIDRAVLSAATPSLLPAFANAHGRAVWHTRLAAALARTGLLEEAGEHAALALAATPEWFDRWAVVVDATLTADLDRAAAVLVPLLRLDTTGLGVAHVAERFPPAVTAELCGIVVAMADGAPVPAGIVATGLLAALVGQQDAAFPLLLSVAGQVDPLTRSQLAARCEARGRADVGAALRALSPV